MVIKKVFTFPLINGVKNLIFSFSFLCIRNKSGKLSFQNVDIVFDTGEVRQRSQQIIFISKLFFYKEMNYFLFTVFSAYEQVGQQFQVESRIISSSVQPPVGKLQVEPVVIVFGGVQVIVSHWSIIKTQNSVVYYADFLLMLNNFVDKSRNTDPN